MTRLLGALKVLPWRLPDEKRPRRSLLYSRPSTDSSEFTPYGLQFTNVTSPFSDPLAMASPTSSTKLK